VRGWAKRARDYEENNEVLKKAAKGGVNESQLKFLEETQFMSQNRFDASLF
jgi:hypothetical protein